MFWIFNHIIYTVSLIKAWLNYKQIPEVQEFIFDHRVVNCFKIRSSKLGNSSSPLSETNEKEKSLNAFYHCQIYQPLKKDYNSVSGDSEVPPHLFWLCSKITNYVSTTCTPFKTTFHPDTLPICTPLTLIYVFCFCFFPPSHLPLSGLLKISFLTFVVGFSPHPLTPAPPLEYPHQEGRDRYFVS